MKQIFYNVVLYVCAIYFIIVIVPLSALTLLLKTLTILVIALTYTAMGEVDMARKRLGTLMKQKNNRECTNKK